MPIKKDGTGKRWVEMDLLVPGTPEQVWQAMATGSGNAGWFVRGEIEPRVGGGFALDFGAGGKVTGEVTMWEPPHLFGYVERDWAPDAPPIATEITITGRSGDRCRVRMVHSLFTTSDEWDDQIEGFEAGWPGFLAMLRAYLAHFPGEEASSFMLGAPVATDALSLWARLTDLLGLAGASVGERRSAASGPDLWSARVELVHQDESQRYFLLVIDEPSPGAALVGTYDNGGDVGVSVCRYFYGEGAAGRAAESEARWSEWLDATFGEKAEA